MVPLGWPHALSGRLTTYNDGSFQFRNDVAELASHPWMLVVR